MLAWICCIVFFQIDWSWAQRNDFKIHISLDKYYNWNNFLSNGKHCEKFHFFGDGCDPRVDVTIYNQLEILFYARSKVYNNRNFVDKVDSFIFEGQDLPKNLTIIMKIWDVDSFTDQLILNVKKNIQLLHKQVKKVEFKNQYSMLVVTFTVEYAHHFITTPRPILDNPVPARKFAVPTIKHLNKEFIVMAKSSSKSSSAIHWTIGGLVICVTVMILVLIIVFGKYCQTKRKSKKMMNIINEKQEDMDFFEDNVETNLKRKINYHVDDENIYETA